MSLSLVFAAVLAAFALGMFSGHRNAFPFGILLRLKRFLSMRNKPAAAGATPAFVVDLATKEALLDKRRRLANYIWGEDGLPLHRLPDVLKGEVEDVLSRQFQSLATAVRWTIRMDHGIDSVALVLTPHRHVRDLAVIYQQGHEGSISHGRHVIRRLLEHGYRVVALAMPLLGGNSQPVIQFRRHGPVRLQDHDHFFLLDHEFGGNSIRFFIEPVLACINQLAAQGVKNFAMLGWSGGGWTTTLCAALDQRIGRSFSVAGSLPFSLRIRGELADYENHLPALYEIANYPELYVLAAYGPGRSSLQILNEFDTVAWSGRRGELYQDRVQQTLTRLGEGRFSCMIDSSWVGHGISRISLEHVLSRLDVHGK